MCIRDRRTHSEAAESLPAEGQTYQPEDRRGGDLRLSDVRAHHPADGTEGRPGKPPADARRRRERRRPDRFGPRRRRAAGIFGMMPQKIYSKFYV